MNQKCRSHEVASCNQFTMEKNNFTMFWSETSVLWKVQNWQQWKSTAMPAESSMFCWDCKGGKTAQSPNSLHIQMSSRRNYATFYNPAFLYSHFIVFMSYLLHHKSEFKVISRRPIFSISLHSFSKVQGVFVLFCF